MMILISALVLSCTSSLVSSFSIPPRTSFHHHLTSSSSALGITAADAIATLSSSQQTTVETIASSIPDLAPKPDLSWTPADGITLPGSSGPAVIDGRDAAGNSNVAWLASVSVPSKMSSLTVFNGPLTDVPHLLSRCVVDTEIKFALDFRPRAYGAYEKILADGSYPGPDVLGRDAFTYSGNRNDYSTKFANDEVLQFLQETLEKLEGVSPNPVEPKTELELLTDGPHAISVTAPLTDANIATIVAARSKAAEYWLSWALADGNYHRPGAPINAQHVYDSKYRQNAYSALLSIYEQEFGGADGARLAAAESGPLDEAYVGGGS